MAQTGVFSPNRARVAARTLRKDRWWVPNVLTLVGLLAFIAYATFRAFEGQHYYATPYLSPFYSPCLAVSCTEGASHLGQPVGEWWRLSPALIILVFPLGFRLTCYYYRKAYYRSFWLSPPACGVAEPHGRYSGETRFPLIFQNSHRYFFYVGLAFSVNLTWDAAIAFRDEQGAWGHMGLGAVVLVVNAVLIWLYTLSCHSCRHVFGGRVNSFSKHPIRYWAWTQISKLNATHMLWAWVSLVWIAFADLYVRLVVTGAISDPKFF